MRIREERTEDQENLDMMLYCYGLELSGDVPLLEPLEEGRVREIGTIVIVIDTSGSCLGDTLSRFFAETGEMFRNLRELGHFQKVILIQCDAEIRNEVVISGEDELGKLKILKNIRGGGGTDFRPIFKRVEELEKQGEKVEALICLTDGWGSYPEKKRENVYFVMEAEHIDKISGRPCYEEAPDWIHTVRLE
jgi:predicted metal-dependent peptidase